MSRSTMRASAMVRSLCSSTNVLVRLCRAAILARSSRSASRSDLARRPRRDIVLVRGPNCGRHEHVTPSGVSGVEGGGASVWAAAACLCWRLGVPVGRADLRA